MPWYWYVEKEDELMLDIDGSSDPSESNLGPTRARLETAIASGALGVLDSVYIYRSNQPGHYHLIIPLAAPMPAIERWAWTMQLRSDLFRARCNLVRLSSGIDNAALLIAPKPWIDFYREADARCYCIPKHDANVFKLCPAARSLRGPEIENENYFGPCPKHRHVPALSWREGRMPIERFAFSEPIDRIKDDHV